MLYSSLVKMPDTGNKAMEKSDKVIIIAEAGVNHNGDYDRAV